MAATASISLLCWWSNYRALSQPPNFEWNSPGLAQVQVQYNAVYGRLDEPMHRADIYRPQGSKQGENLPGIILIHGGAWTVGDKSNDALHAKRLASLGFIVMVVNYRLAPKHPFPSQLDDCCLALEWFCDPLNTPDLDIQSIGGWGYSAGGHLVGLLATKPMAKIPRLKACVVGAAPCDLSQIPERSQMLTGLLGGPRSQFPDRYRDASPVFHVSPDDPPFFLFHGTKDLLVPPDSSRIMRDALEKNGVPYEYFEVQNKAHLMTFIDKEVTEKSFEFLKLHLHPKR
jgi:acetyl esterase/lipase